MKKALVVYSEEEKGRYSELISMLQDVLMNASLPTEVISIKKGENSLVYTKRFSDESVLYICTIDMAGFQMNTLLETPVYNIMRAKQIHIIVDSLYIDIEQWKEWALNLYLCISEDEIKWREKCSHIPNVLTYSALECDSQKRVLKNNSNLEKLTRLFQEFEKDINGC